MLPISARDIIEFRPALDRVNAAKAALEAATSDPAPNDIVTNAAQHALDAAELAMASHDPVYKIRTPTIRSKSASARDLMSEGVGLRSDAELISMLIQNDDLIAFEDLAFLKSLNLDDIDPLNWPRLSSIARSVPDGATVIADRIYYGNMSRIHNIRHHLVVDGQRCPLPESYIEIIPSEYIGAIGNKIDSMIYPSVDELKNSDAP